MTAATQRFDAAPAPSSNRGSLEKHYSRLGALLIAPTLIFFVAVIVYPLMSGVVLSFFAGGFIALAAFAGWAVSAGGLASLAAGSGIAAWAWRLILGRGFKRGAPGSPISPVVEGVIQPYGVDARRPYPAEIEGW